MSCDITKVFLSTIRALRPSQSIFREGGEEAPIKIREDIFSERARALLRELTVVKGHICTAGKLSLALATDDAASQNSYHDLAKLINDALGKCGELLDQLKRVALVHHIQQAGEALTKLQLTSHRKAVCSSLDELLKTLRRSRDDQVSTYCRRLELTNRLRVSTIATVDGGGLRSRFREKQSPDNSWMLFGDSSMNNRSNDALPPESLSSDELQQLEMENVEVYLRFLSEKNEIHHLGSQISEIGRLQSMVMESLVEQTEMAERIGERVVGATELVQEANKHLRQSMDRTRGVRFWLIFILLTLTFSLHFLDWYG